MTALSGDHYNRAGGIELRSSACSVNHTFICNEQMNSLIDAEVQRHGSMVRLTGADVQTDV